MCVCVCVCVCVMFMFFKPPFIAKIYANIKKNSLYSSIAAAVYIFWVSILQRSRLDKIELSKYICH